MYALARAGQTVTPVTGQVLVDCQLTPAYVTSDIGNRLHVLRDDMGL